METQSSEALTKRELYEILRDFVLDLRDEFDIEPLVTGDVLSALSLEFDIDDGLELEEVIKAQQGDRFVKVEYID